jgi:hypothetical protein
MSLGGVPHTVAFRPISRRRSSQSSLARPTQNFVQIKICSSGMSAYLVVAPSPSSLA